MNTPEDGIRRNQLPDRRQRVGRRADNGAVDSEHRLHPPDYSAVIRDILPSPISSEQNDVVKSASLDINFTVQLGRVLYKKSGDLTDEEKSLGFSEASDHVTVPQGKHAGDLLILPFPGEKYLINIFRSSQDEVDLVLYTNDQAKRVIRTATVHPAQFTSHGFDLDPANQNNYGKILNHQLSQFIYDFHEGQGQFKPEGQPTIRRTLRAQPRSKDNIQPRFNLPTMVEANRESAYLNLMGNYLVFASALGPQSSIIDLEEQRAKDVSTYHNADANKRREMETALRKQFDDLLVKGIDHTLEMLLRFKKDAKEPPEEVYAYIEAQRVRFTSKRGSMKINMLLELVSEKQRMAVLNLGDYKKTWLAIFPQGPRTNFWKKRWEKAEASGDQIELAEISEGLRKELGKKLLAKAHDYLEEWHTLSIDSGMPADVALHKVSERAEIFRKSPLSVKTEILKELEARADAALLLLFPVSVRLWGSIVKTDRDEIEAKLNNDFDNASVEDKVRIARELYVRFKRELDIAMVGYADQVYLATKKRELVNRHEDISISQILAKLTGLPRSDQLRIIRTGEII